MSDTPDNIKFGSFENCKVSITTDEGVITVENVSIDFEMHNEFIQHRDISGRMFETLTDCAVMVQFTAHPDDVTFPGKGPSENKELKAVLRPTIRKIRPDKEKE